MADRVLEFSPQRRVTIREEAWQRIAHLPQGERGDYVSDLILAEARRSARRAATYRLEVLRADGRLHHTAGRGLIARQAVAALRRDRARAGGPPRTVRCVRETDGHEMVLVGDQIVERVQP